MKIFSRTDTGRVRSENQDAFFAGHLSDHAAFAVVCDGMGGANAGNIASATAVKSIADYISKSYRGAMTVQEMEKVVQNAITSANIELYDLSLKHAKYNGMGTTVVLAAVIGDEAVIAHVGDSRVYLAEGETITQLTRDHSVVQSLIESGKITPEDAKVHPRKNIITRALGAEEQVAVDLTVAHLNEGAALLLCSDGLTNYVEPAEIAAVLAKEEPQAAADCLVDKANREGGGDNITVVIMTYEGKKG